MAQRIRARLLLTDGTSFEGFFVGEPAQAGGEVVFNTSMTGYQEILTDPSYRGQIVTMTCPLIGNYGVTPADDESERPWVEGFIVREMSPLASSHRAVESLPEWLHRHEVTAIEGIDTRALTRRIREAGAMKGLIAPADVSMREMEERLREVPELEGRDLVKDVTRGRVFEWGEGFESEFRPNVCEEHAQGGEHPHAVVVDYGCKANILRALVSFGFRVTVVPASSGAADILKHEPDGVLLSNGPGDPRVLEHAAATAGELLGRLPVFGICLGHQIMGAALGVPIFKLKFGHHGGNHPVKDLETGRVAVTAQNHGFALEEEGLLARGGVVTHVNLNDATVAGIALPEQRAFGIQFHPEAAPGPHDSLDVFGRFRGMVEEFRRSG